jgi:hypothetical protein
LCLGEPAYEKANPEFGIVHLSNLGRYDGVANRQGQCPSSEPDLLVLEQPPLPHGLDLLRQTVEPL